MVKMEKDSRIEEEFRAYTDGVEAPAVDLTAAKNALKPKKRRGVFYAVLSAAACLLIFALVLVAQLPFKAGGEADPPVSFAGEYSLENAMHTSAELGELGGVVDGDLLELLSPYTQKPNMAADCELYSIEGRGAVLLRAELRVLQQGVRVDAELFFDLTAGECQAQELEAYRSLSKTAYSYIYGVTTENGEYVGMAYGTFGGRDLFLNARSSYDGAVRQLANYFFLT